MGKNLREPKVVVRVRVHGTKLICLETAATSPPPLLPVKDRPTVFKYDNQGQGKGNRYRQDEHEGGEHDIQGTLQGGFSQPVFVRWGCHEPMKSHDRVCQISSFSKDPIQTDSEAVKGNGGRWKMHCYRKVLKARIGKRHA